MKIQCVWNEKMKFTSETDGHRVEMDSKPPFGTDTAMTPKQLVLAGLCGCTAMDVVSLMKKHKQPLESFEVEAEASQTTGGHPAVFKEVHLVFKLKGVLDVEKVLEAVMLSQTQYCGVSAMISKAAPIDYVVELNGKSIGAGRAEFR